MHRPGPRALLRRLHLPRCPGLRTAGLAPRAVIIGMGVTGRSVARHLAAQGWTVVAIEDGPLRKSVGQAGSLGIGLGAETDVDGADLVVPSPGVPPHHPALVRAGAAGVAIVSEVELAWRSAGDKRIVAVTGTNGKTTVTTMVAAMLVRSGRSAVAAGNIGLPLVDAVAEDVEVMVAEVSSFQLHWTDGFRPHVGTWLNLAEDHLDWHPDMVHYKAAKSRIWARQGGGDVAVANADDAEVMDAAASSAGRLLTFGTTSSSDFRVANGELRGPQGAIIRVEHLRRRLPHDVANALAATATAMAAGAEVGACAAVLAEFAGLPHRVTLVGEAGGVSWYDDSKATTPSAVLAALEGFDSVVLIAGGRNKGLDLGVLGQGAHHLRAVVAIGEAAAEVESAFAGVVPVTAASSMRAAVASAAEAARPGDVVLLSPACASQDWYANYGARGADFSEEVRRLTAK
ncbi:MAG TPA: UDP-N-acetylmuramoyl-L-alanine--D-glutamate ligase [Acidimicrobiales bacterium]|nr:UDP-N-acetylmuramoyl-L-alanine--D-glutamate ligase [Acidimicrobiales bacterium]